MVNTMIQNGRGNGIQNIKLFTVFAFNVIIIYVHRHVVQCFVTPSADEKTEGFVANAYSTAYSINDNGNKIELPAFEDKTAYSERVELGQSLV